MKAASGAQVLMDAESAVNQAAAGAARAEGIYAFWLRPSPWMEGRRGSCSSRAYDLTAAMITSVPRYLREAEEGIQALALTFCPRRNRGIS
jgi:hypothetical protein